MVVKPSLQPSSLESEVLDCDSGYDEAMAPPAKSKKRRPSIPPEDIEDATAPSSSASTNASPSKRRRKDPAVTAAEQEEKRRKQEEKAALKAEREKEKQEKKALADAAKKKRQEEAAVKKAEKQAEAEAKAEKRRRKEKWEEYWKENDVLGATVKWPLDERPLTITQTDATKLYTLNGKELGCLRHCPEHNVKYGNTMKLFDEDEVKILAFRKYATLAGVADDDEPAMLKRGKELWEEEGRRGPGKTIYTNSGSLALDHDQGGSPNWWRDPRELRAMGYDNGRLRTEPTYLTSPDFNQY